MSSATPTWLDRLLNKLISVGGVAQPQRGTVDFQTGFTSVDDPTNDTLHLTAVGTAGLPGQTNLTLANGANENVNPVSKTVLRIGGPTAAFSIGGFVAPAAPVTLTVINTTSQPLTFNHEDVGSTASNRIATQLLGANAVLQPRTGLAVLTYDMTAARWQLQSVGPSLPKFFDVREFGAKGDGTTDDSGAFATAITLAAAVGGTVYIPATGNFYNLKASLTLPTNIRLLGDHSQASGSSVLGSVVRFTSGAAGFIAPNQDLGIENLRVEGDTASGPLLNCAPGSGAGYWRIRNVRFVCGNKAQGAIVMGAAGAGNGAQNIWSTFDRVDIFAAAQQSVSLISLYGISAGLGVMKFRDCTLTGGGLVGSGNESTAPFIHVETTDTNVVESIIFEQVTLEIPVAGGWTLLSVYNVTLRDCWAGDLQAHPNTAPLILIDKSTVPGAPVSQRVLIENLFTDIGLNTAGLETVLCPFASGQGPTTIRNSTIKSIGNGIPNGGTIHVYETVVPHVNGDNPVGIGINDGTAVRTELFSIGEDTTVNLANGDNVDVGPNNKFTSYLRATSNASAPVSIGGFALSPQIEGTILILDYRGFTQPLTINHEDSAETVAGNRIHTQTLANVTVGTEATLVFIYDSGNSRWRLISAVTSPVKTGTANTQVNQETSFIDLEHLTGISTQATLNVPLTISGSSATILVDAVSRVTTAGGTASVGDTYTAAIQFGAKNVGGTVSRVGALNTPYAVDTDGSMSTCAFSTNVVGTNFQIILTMPATFGAGTVVDTTLKARVVYS